MRRPTARSGVGAAVGVAALLLAALPPLCDEVAAQTGLLLVGGPEVGSVASAVVWQGGPVGALEAPAGAELLPALRRAVAELADRGARGVVVVPLVAEGEALSADMRAGAPPDGLAAPVPVRIAAAVRTGRREAAVAGDLRAVDSTARGVQARARAVLHRLPDDGSATGPVFELDAVNVTATRTPLEVFGTAAPVTVVDGRALDRHAAEGMLGPLEEIPGVELEGVGTLRRQPVVRGFGGQRVLLLEDGLRLSNGRRRLGSVEPAALAGPGTVDRIEVVRGPASVLYGSDAIGGVVNLVTRGADPHATRPLAGSIRLAASTAGSARSAAAAVHGRNGPLAVRVSASARAAESYDAPPGAFGDVSLPDGATVHDTGARDRHVRGEASLALAGGGRLLLRGEAFESGESAFGWLDPALLGDDTRVRLHFPEQRFHRFVAGWRSGDLALPVADALEATAWIQDNRRTFVTDVLAPLGPGAPPDATIRVVSDNRTDLRTVGARLESTRLLGRHGLTWGLDVHRERSRGADTTTTTIRGLGPPSTNRRGGSGVPDATVSSLAGFVQDRVRLGVGSELTVGVRYEDVRATPDAPGSGVPADDGFDDATHIDRTVVGAASVLHPVGSDVALVASVARGFRSPNLVERFFSGPTPGGQGVWVRNPDLEAETSTTTDLGVRVRRGALQAELFVFRTSLRNGIRLEPTGRDTGGGPELRNENVDELVVRGVEAWARWRLRHGLDAAATVELQDRRNPDDPDDPLVEGVRTRLTATLAWSPANPVELRWRGRREGAQREVLDPDGPVGAEVPAYQVHALHADLTVSSRYRLTVGVENLFDQLYARAGNVGFFRPEPGRRVVVAVRARF